MPVGFPYQKGQSQRDGAVNFGRELFKLFHKRVFFVARNGSEQLNFDGMVHPDDLNTIIIDAESRQGFSYLVGHELGHSIQHQQPKLYDDFHDRGTGL